ncbi:MAG: UDP-N-acetylmuramoyl-L-alanyl-D-glutamate--2,6-diaminopimelate ligase [Candidatus Saccharibacteria bacterium]|nr:UDP-N-acetylmuramoyl-L-alanyl-D-glutamate--2,6-diaminopimelate ligase [Candidatus Saccharibacteria bacterium]
MSVKNFLTDHIPGYNKLVLPWHFAQAVFASTRYGFPARKMKVIGVTGTNGKTSTSFMVWKMLNEAGYKTGIMTTVGWGVDKITPQVEHMTTEKVGTLNKRMRAIKKQGAEYLVLETTSHALAQFRTLGVPFEVAVITNVTHEHLDYHGTFEKYRDAKRKLFKKAKYGVINADDASAVWFINDMKKGLKRVPIEDERYLTYGIKGGRLHAADIELGTNGVKYEAAGGLKMRDAEGKVFETKDLRIKTQIPGTFTVYNTLAAAGVGFRLGLTAKQIADGLGALESVEGRMNRIDCGQNFDVIVDYAHTPDALQKVFDSVKGHDGTVISVHGGAGRRDETTRSERGEILARGSDIVIITEDDSRDEDPAKIAEMFVEGCRKAGKVLEKNLFVEIDRKKAIEKALKMAKKGDLVLILGKGHEKTILRADGPHEFEDIKVTEKLLKKK